MTWNKIIDLARLAFSVVTVGIMGFTTYGLFKREWDAQKRLSIVEKEIARNNNNNELIDQSNADENSKN